MGYNTAYRIEITGKDNDLALAYLEKISGYGESIHDESIKWFNCVEDAEKTSKRFPEVLIEIYGDGDESDDNWRMLIKNGKAKRVTATLTYPPLTEDDL